MLGATLRRRPFHTGRGAAVGGVSGRGSVTGPGAAPADRSESCPPPAFTGSQPSCPVLVAILALGRRGRRAEAGCVLIPSRIQHDQCRGHDLDPAEHDEHAGVDRDGACRSQERRQQPHLECQPANACRAAGPYEAGNLRYVGRPGQPSTGKARDLCDGQHRWLTCSGRLARPGSPGVTSSAGGAASSWYGVMAATVDAVIIWLPPGAPCIERDRSR